MAKIKIDPTGAKYILVAMLIAKIFTPFPRMLSLFTGGAAWLVVLLSGLLALGGFWLLGLLLARFPGQSIAGISREVLGKTGGSIACVCYAFYFIYVSGLMFREFGSGFRIAVLPQTPLATTTLLFTLVVVFTAYRGVESLARMASYLVPTLIVVWGLMILGTGRFFQAQFLAPWFGFGVSHTLLLSLPETSLYSEILTLGVMASLLKPEHLHRVGYGAMGTSIAMLTISFVALEGAFPYPALSRLFFPMMDLTRLIEIGEFLQRLEAVFVFLWVFIAGFKISMALLSGAMIVQELTGLPDFRPLLPALSLIVYTVSFLPVDVIHLAWLDAVTVRTWSWPISIGLPAVTLAVAVLRGKRGAGHDQASAPAG